MTEKEINLILFLYNNKTPCSIENLQKNVWGFKKDLETHTVETHVHRLRKKIEKKFGKNETDEDRIVLSFNLNIQS